MTHNELFPFGSEQPRPKDLKLILLSYIRYWYLFIILIAIALGVAYLYLRYYAVSQYSAYSTILIKDDKTSTDILGDLSSFKYAKNIDNETEVISSKRLMKRVISELGLASSYYVEGRVRDTEIYGNVLPIKVLVNDMDSTLLNKTFTVLLKSNNSFKLDDYTGNSKVYRLGEKIHKPYGTFTIVAATTKSFAGLKLIVRFQNIQQVADYYNSAIEVQPVNKNASVLIISLVDPISDKARDVINKLTSVYNKEAIEDKNLITTNTLKFLDNRLQYLRTDLSGVEKTVEKYKSVNGLTDITTQASDYTTQASNYNAQLSEWAIQIDILESIEGYLGKSTDNNSMVPSTLGIKDETLLNLIGKFNDLQLERERMLRTTQPGNPLVQNLNEQLVNLKINLLENLRNIKRGLQITSNNLKSSSGQFQSKIKRVPAMERELLEINRQQLIKQSIYSYLLQKREETALSLAATASIARVIDPAVSSRRPISPNSQTVYLIALLIGLGIPFAGIYVSNMLNNKVQTQQDVANATATPILGEIAHNDSKEVVVVANGYRTPIAEMFRLIRANLSFATMGREKSVLLINSSISGEGKTFFSINLGASLTITGKRVILLDLDLRNPKVSKELQMPDAIGITNYLVSHDVSISDIIRHCEKVPGLFIASSGPLPPNPAELMMSPKLAHLIQELKDIFDYIIIDAPPIGQVADALTLSALVDFTLYLVRYNYTKKSQLEI